MNLLHSLLLVLSTLSAPARAACGPDLERPFFARVPALESVTDAPAEVANRLDRAFILYILRRFSPVEDWLSRPVRYRFDQANYVATLEGERFDLRRADGARVLFVYPVNADLEEVKPERAIDVTYGRDLSFRLYSPTRAVPALEVLLKMRRPRDRAWLRRELAARRDYLARLNP